MVYISIAQQMERLSDSATIREYIKRFGGKITLRHINGTLALALVSPKDRSIIYAENACDMIRACYKRLDNDGFFACTNPDDLRVRL